jgi:hypothetical protein
MKVKLTIEIPSWLDSICTWPVTAYRKLKYGYTYRRINLGEGRFTIVDPPDFYQLNHFHWYAEGQDEHIYAVRNIIKPHCKTTTMRLSREIMSAPAGLLVDHRNNNTLDNRRDNLRLATPSQNRINSRRDKSKTSSRFIGVSLEKGRGKWLAYINYDGKRIHLGRFDSETEAAKAYDAAARKYHGEFARLNFPESADPRRFASQNETRGQAGQAAEHAPRPTDCRGRKGAERT